MASESISLRLLVSKTGTGTCSTGCCETDYFTKKLLLVNSGVQLYCDGVRGTEDFAGAEEYDFDLSGYAGGTLVFRFEQTAFVGNYEGRVYFEADDGSGSLIPTDEWSYLSGTTDTWHRDVLDRLVALYGLLNP